MRDRRLLLAALAALVALALAACGSSGSSGGSGGGGSPNGVAAKNANQIVAAATAAIDAVNTVRVTGSVKSGSRTIHLDLHLVSGKGATGSMAENGLSFKLISVGGEAYINGTPRFWHQFGGASAAQLLQGHWLRAPATTGDFASFSSLTNLHRLLTALLAHHGALSKGATSTLRGTPVIAVHDSARGGTLFVATTGKPYPLQISNQGASGGQLSFSEFNRSVTLTPPTNSIDITKLGG